MKRNSLPASIVGPALPHPRMSTAPGRLEGWVMKKAMTAHSNKWQKRYMVLQDDKLSYFGSEKEARAGKSARNVIILTASCLLARPAYFHPHEFELRVETGKTLYAYTEAKAEGDAWVAAIMAVISAKVAALPKRKRRGGKWGSGRAQLSCKSARGCIPECERRREWQGHPPFSH